MHNRIVVLMVVAIAASACSSMTQTAYYIGQQWQRQECNKVADQGERQQCMRKTEGSYEDYRRQSEDGKK